MNKDLHSAFITSSGLAHPAYQAAWATVMVKRPSVRPSTSHINRFFSQFSTDFGSVYFIRSPYLIVIYYFYITSTHIVLITIDTWTMNQSLDEAHWAYLWSLITPRKKVIISKKMSINIAEVMLIPCLKYLVYCFNTLWSRQCKVDVSKSAVAAYFLVISHFHVTFIFNRKTYCWNITFTDVHFTWLLAKNI